VREKKTNNIQRYTHQNHSRFLKRNLKSKKEWSEVFWALNENNFNTGILYPAKLLFKIDGAKKSSMISRN
jgi:hypothetical protein